MRVRFVDLTREWDELKDQFIPTFEEFGASGMYVLGDYTSSFEESFASFSRYKHAAAVSTGLTALETALRAHGIGEGDEVITVSNSAVATALAVSHVGATPVFCDIGDDFLMDPDAIEACITPNTKALLPVHLFGKICDMDRINAIAKKHGLVVIEDACQAHGAAFTGESAQNTKAFSFYPTKNLGALGEGGMVISNDEAVIDFVKSYRNYGQQGRYNHIRKGNNYRLAPLQCVLLHKKLNRLSEYIERRRVIAQKYITSLSDIAGLEIGAYDPASAYHLFVVRVQNGKRDALKEFLASKEIDSIIHYPTLIHKQACYSDEYTEITLPRTEAMQDEILSLPCYPFLKDDELEYICEQIHAFFS